MKLKVSIKKMPQRELMTFGAICGVVLGSLAGFTIGYLNSSNDGASLFNYNGVAIVKTESEMRQHQIYVQTTNGNMTNLQAYLRGVTNESDRLKIKSEIETLVGK